MLKTSVIGISLWNSFSFKYLSLGITRFVFHQNVPSPETGAVHQFAFRIDQFCSLAFRLVAMILWYQKFFFRVPHWFSWSFQFSLHVLQFRWMISNWLCNFGFDIFDDIFQFILLPIVKGHYLLWVILGLL